MDVHQDGYVDRFSVHSTMEKTDVCPSGNDGEVITVDWQMITNKDDK